MVPTLLPSGKDAFPKENQTLKQHGDIGIEVYPTPIGLEYHTTKTVCFKFTQGTPDCSFTLGHRYGYLRRMIACPSVQMAAWEITLQAACTEP